MLKLARTGITGVEDLGEGCTRYSDSRFFSPDPRSHRGMHLSRPRMTWGRMAQQSGKIPCRALDLAFRSFAELRVEFEALSRSGHADRCDDSAACIEHRRGTRIDTRFET